MLNDVHDFGVRGTGCRRQTLLQYFGEGYSPDYSDDPCRRRPLLKAQLPSDDISSITSTIPTDFGNIQDQYPHQHPQHPQKDQQRRRCCDLCDRNWSFAHEGEKKQMQWQRQTQQSNPISLLEPTLRLLTLLKERGAYNLTNGISANQHNLNELVVVKRDNISSSSGGDNRNGTTMNGTSSWKWWRGLSRMLVRDGWLERGVVTTGTNPVQESKQPPQRRFRGRKKSRRRQRKGGSGSRNTKTEMNVVFVTDLGKKLLMRSCGADAAESKEYQAVRCLSSTDSHSTTRIVQNAISNKMLMWPDLDMVQESLVESRSSSSLPTADCQNWGNSKWRKKEILRRARIL